MKIKDLKVAVLIKIKDLKAVVLAEIENLKVIALIKVVLTRDKVIVNKFNLFIKIN